MMSIIISIMMRKFISNIALKKPLVGQKIIFNQKLFFTHMCSKPSHPDPIVMQINITKSHQIIIRDSIPVACMYVSVFCVGTICVLGLCIDNFI
jgi:hypothetical protein